VKKERNPPRLEGKSHKVLREKYWAKKKDTGIAGMEDFILETGNIKFGKMRGGGVAGRKNERRLGRTRAE